MKLVWGDFNARHTKKRIPVWEIPGTRTVLFFLSAMLGVTLLLLQFVTTPHYHGVLLLVGTEYKTKEGEGGGGSQLCFNLNP